MAQVAAKTTSSNLPPHNASIFRLMDSHVASMAPLLLVAAAYFIVVYAVRENAKQRRLPIVPSIIPWLGNAFAFYRDPVKLLQSCKYVPTSDIILAQPSNTNQTASDRSMDRYTSFFWPVKTLSS